MDKDTQLNLPFCKPLFILDVPVEAFVEATDVRYVSRLGDQWFSSLGQSELLKKLEKAGAVDLDAVRIDGDIARRGYFMADVHVDLQPDEAAK